MNPKDPTGSPMKSRVMKRSTLVDGRKTSVTLEDEFWTALK
jgi:predicted DNA-binding ribbon-helix-helix protein